MKPLVNLAREPFRNRRLFWLSLLGLFCIAGWSWLAAASQQARLSLQVATEQSALQRLEAQLGKAGAKPKDPLTGKDLPEKTIAVTPEINKELLAASELIERRAFSWSQLLNDIERHIPRNVRVLRIAVNNIKAETDAPTNAGLEPERSVSLVLEVVGKSSQDVTRMITDFERAGMFTVNPREKKLIEGMEDVQWSLDVDYRPPVVRGLRPNPNQVAEKR